MSLKPLKQGLVATLVLCAIIVCITLPSFIVSSTGKGIVRVVLLSSLVTLVTVLYEILRYATMPPNERSFRTARIFTIATVSVIVFAGIDLLPSQLPESDTRPLYVVGVLVLLCIIAIKNINWLRSWHR